MVTSYPILFSYQDILAGNGFVAGVEVRGRYLMVQEDEGSWAHGVNPGGLSAGGASQKEAAAAFRDMYRKALFDIIEEAATIDELRTEVANFVQQTNGYYAEAWREAVILVREGKLTSDWLETQKAEEVQVLVTELVLEEIENEESGTVRRPTPSQNQVEHLVQAA